MESTQIQALYEPPLAAMQQLREKPHQGFETRKTTGKPGSSSCNFTVTLGLQATVVENGVRETYSARYYNPATGRFLSRDPEDGNRFDPASLHKYLYAGGDPVNASDPTGRYLFETALIEGGSKEAAITIALRRLGWEVAVCLLETAVTLYEISEGHPVLAGLGGLFSYFACRDAFPPPYLPIPPWWR
jgi:RHS repeat-associated protein